MSEMRWRVVRRAWPDAGGARGLAVAVVRRRRKRQDFTREVQRGCKENIMVKARRSPKAEKMSSSLIMTDLHFGLAAVCDFRHGLGVRAAHFRSLVLEIGCFI